MKSILVADRGPVREVLPIGGEHRCHENYKESYGCEMQAKKRAPRWCIQAFTCPGKGRISENRRLESQCWRDGDPGCQFVARSFVPSGTKARGISTHMRPCWRIFPA